MMYSEATARMYRTGTYVIVKDTINKINNVI